jgi:hypothetical protein
LSIWLSLVAVAVLNCLAVVAQVVLEPAQALL